MTVRSALLDDASIMTSVRNQHRRDPLGSTNSRYLTIFKPREPLAHDKYNPKSVGIARAVGGVSETEIRLGPIETCSELDDIYGIPMQIFRADGQSLPGLKSVKK